MSENITTFSGSVPRNYDDYLGPLLFESFAIDLASRVNIAEGSTILELAAGTGRLTRHLINQIPDSASLTATDLNADMLELGKEKIPDEKITWAVVDMLDIPYEDETFDLIVCQFGVMLVPDQLKVLQEIHRVLKKGGKVIYSVWGDITRNGIWNIGAKVVKSYLAIDPIMQVPGPFSMQDESLVLKLMMEAGFGNSNIEAVTKQGTTPRAAVAAQGFIQGLPIYMIIKKKDPALVELIQEALEKELIKELGDVPMETPLYTLVITAEK